MEIILSRESLLSPLQFVSGVVERRQTLPILSNVLLKANGHELSLVGTDLEVELIARSQLENAYDMFETTVSARKLMDICRSLSEQAEIILSLQKDKLIVKSGKSRFSLATLPANEFPQVEAVEESQRLTIAAEQLKILLEKTQFAMAQQDVRYFLNGALLHTEGRQLNVVATDGHRLAKASCELSTDAPVDIIIPRKAIVEMLRLLSDTKNDISAVIDNNHICISTDAFTLTSKLIDGRYPDYRKVIPRQGDKTLIIDRDVLKTTLNRVAVLSNEKYRGVRFELRDNLLRLSSHNPEQEQADDEITIDYQGADLDIGFNITYILDVLNVMISSKVSLTFGDANSSLLIDQAENDANNAVYVVMPMRL